MDATGWVAIIGAVGTNIVIVLGAYYRLHAQGAATHGLVNRQHDESLARSAQLAAALTAAGIVVPPFPPRDPPATG
jgi:hypothetical protein